ncbi:MAG: hypothetical protein WCV68_00885 [Candidatus Paceibacterota bacterium]
MQRKKTLKSVIIPSSWKDDIDATLERELVGANRYFAEANPRLSEIVERRSLIPPQEFFQELCARWNWHNEFYENLLEPALPLLLEPNVFRLTPKRIEILRDAYMAGSLVDQATLVVSAAIKKHVSYWMGCLPECKCLSDEDLGVFLSLPATPYPVQYVIDHISYLISMREGNDATSEREQLIRQYHAGDEEIFSGRMRRFAYLVEDDVFALKRRTEELTYEDTRWVKHFYLGLERPRIRAMMQSLAYDNNEEKQIARELVGISGFVLRKEVLRYLVETKILPAGSGIYQYQDSDIEAALNKLITYRRDVMDRQVAPFGQHGLTCSAACLTMVAAHFGLAELSEGFEEEVAEASKSNITIGQHYSGVAVKAVSLGLETVLVHSAPQMFDNSQKWLPAELFESLMNEYRSYLEKIKGHRLARVECNARLTPEDIRSYLEDGYLVMVAGVISGGILHSILLTGYNSGGYLVIDPIGGRKRQMRERELASFMDTKIGRWIMALRSDQESVLNLTKSLPAYQEEARKLLA